MTTSAATPRYSLVPFQAHVDLLESFLAHRDAIVGRIEGLLNAQRKPIDYLQNGPLLARAFDECFTVSGEVTGRRLHLRAQLEEAHWAGGFRPRPIPGLHNGPADPTELTLRAFHMWRQTRWPGRNGRLRYAHTLFNLYVLRCLELLSMRLWDDGEGGAGNRLAQIQAVLDRLWGMKPVDQPAFVRDARWLIQLAQSLATDDLGAYFDMAQRVSDTLPAADRLEIHAAGVRMAAGHLRSQLRYQSLKTGASIGEARLVSATRTSNALDFALLVQELAPLLAAYEAAADQGDVRTRRRLADAICQGISADPDLFVNRVELLGAYSMIEQLFITTGPDGSVAFTPMGTRHAGLLAEYTARIGRTAPLLCADCGQFRPRAGTYSPYGILYGFSADLIKHMALKASLPDAETRFSLEDVFVNEEAGAGTLSWVTGWRKLPHLPREIERQFEYPQEFADAVFARVEQALRRRTGADAADAQLQPGRLFVTAAHGVPASTPSPIPDLPARYIRSSDARVVDAGRAVACDEPRLLSERLEGKFLASYRSADGWVAISKDVLTDVLGIGRDVKIVGLPAAAAGTLQLMGGSLVVLAEREPS